MTVPWNYTLNVNLHEGAQQQLEFLKEVANHPALDDEKVLKHSLFRYENYWLPLAGKHPNETLAAPLDVEWMWLCHMLSPVNYQRDCNLLVGRVVSHTLCSAMQRRKFQQKARSLWQAEYCQEPFVVELDPSLYYTDDDLPSRLSYDVMAAAARQRVFAYQVSLPHFKDAQFLSTAELRYKRFLYLLQQDPGRKLIPSYDIDLMWHTHMLHPLAYKIDTETILGHTLQHDKDLDGAHPELHVSEAFVETRELWCRTFDVNFEVCGCTYRGQPTAGRLHALTPQQNFMASTKTATFIIEKVDVQGLPALKGKLVFQLFTGLNGKISKCAATFKGEPPWQGKAVPTTDFETDTVNYLKIRVLDQTGVLACFGTREIVGEKDIDLRPTLDSLTHETSVEHSVSLSQVYGATVAHVTTHFCWPQRGPVHLYLRVGIFTHSAVPDKPESVFCHVPLRKTPKGIENASYLAASHSFVNHSESVVLTCRVLHSVDLLQSAVYVFYQDKMAAVAHLVGLDQLPLPTQIYDPRKVPYLNPRAGERAVLIKNHSGDWAVVIGRWAAVRKGGSRMGSRRGRDGLPGQLMIRVRELAEFGWRELQLNYTEQQWGFTLDDLHADLKDGTIRIDNPESQFIAEKVALTFSVALLHVLCMPRPQGWKRGTSLRPRSRASRRSTRSGKVIPSDEMPFVLAAGVLQETPTNSYIRQTHGVSAWTSDREALLGPANTDLLSCRPEDGLGGMWAQLTPGVHGLFAQGAHVVPDTNSGCSAQIFPDGSSSMSAQIMPDGNSSCSQIFVEVPPPPSPTILVAGVKEGGKKGESEGVKQGLSTLVVPGGKSVAASASSLSLTSLTSLSVPDGKSPALPILIVSDEQNGSDGIAAHEKKSLVSDGKTETGAGDHPVSDSTRRVSSSDSPLVSAKSESNLQSAVVPVPGEKSFGISALSMLGGKLSATMYSAGPAPRTLPSVSVEDSGDCAVNHVHKTARRSKSSEVFRTSPKILTTSFTASALADESGGDGCVDKRGTTAEDSDATRKRSEDRSVDGESAESPTSVDEELQNFGDLASSSSSSSFRTAIGAMSPLPPMLGMPEPIAAFQGGKLSARDMIDICEERIYSDYRCSVETGGVDDLIPKDAKLDVADQEIIVAVQSRRNSRRKDPPSKLHNDRTAKDSGTGAAETQSQDGAKDTSSVSEGDFAASLSAALAASLNTAETRLEPEATESDSGRQQGTCSKSENTSGDCSGTS